MRVLLTTYGTRGDVEPLVALALQLRALGAEVRMCTPPDEEFAERLAGLGIPAVPVGLPIRKLMGGGPPSAAELARYRSELLDAQFDVLPSAADGCDALVAAGLAQVAARSVAEAAGIPYVYVTYSAVNLPSPHHAPPPRSGWAEPVDADNETRWEHDARLVDAQFREPLNARRAALGLPPVAGVRDHVYSDRPWLAADPALGPWPDGTGLPVVQTGVWTTVDERPLPADLVAFLAAGPPPVYVGFGSISPAPGIARWAVEISRARGYRVLVSRGWADLDLIDGRDDCFGIGDVNHQRLFRALAAVIHHGGAGTAQTAARAGIPQVVVPSPVADTPYWAGRVAASQVGAALDGPTATLESLTAAFETALAPETRERAKALGAEIRDDGAAVAARLLLDSLGCAGRRVRPPPTGGGSPTSSAPRTGRDRAAGRGHSAGSTAGSTAASGTLPGTAAGTAGSARNVTTNEPARTEPPGVVTQPVRRPPPVHPEVRPPAPRAARGT